MNLISCENCGCVIDKKRITIVPVEDYEYNRSGRTEDWVYIDDMGIFIKKIQCPACKNKISPENGDI